MIVTILIWCYVFFLSVLYGHLILNTFFPKYYSTESIDSIFKSFFAGFAAINFLASLFSLFIPTGLLSNVILLIILCAGYTFTHTKLPKCIKFQHPIARRRKKYFFLILAICLVIITTYTTSGKVKNSDSYLYHAQSIHWIESYPAIKGLGNFFIRFAYNSSWFVQTALFSFAFLGGPSFHVLSGLLFTAFGLYILAELLLNEKSDLPETITGFLLLPLTILTLSGQLSSPSTDLPSALLIWLVVYYSFQLLRNKQYAPDVEFTILLTSIFAVTVKLSSLPIAIIPAFFTSKHLIKKEWQKIGFILLTVLLCFSPWILRSIIQSGYLVYPMEFTGLPVEWKIPSTLLQEDVEHIRVWGFDKVLNNEQVMSQTYFERMTIWFGERSINQKVLFAGSIFGPFFTIPMIYFLEKKKASLLVPLFAIFAGLTYWVTISPNIRFGYVWLLMINALFIGYGVGFLLTFIKKNEKLLAVTQTLVMVGLCLLLVGSLTLSVRNIFNDQNEPLSARVLFQMDYSVRYVEPCKIYNTNYSVLCAKNYNECGYHNFPCLPWEPVIGIYDETDVRKGFYPIIEE